MILDTTKVTLADGSSKPAIEVYPGARIASDKKRRGVAVDGRSIEDRKETVSLLFTNGESLEGSRDQKVYTWKETGRYCKAMEEIELGDRVVGWVSGLMTVLHVAGIKYHGEAPRRLVEIQTGQPFIADGVVVR